mmetsp:Transcript_13253/g.53138  ORF Transcript_13253/g.53138 Transcript_13253/m.53138 type:complete len:287 (-) Transcript_13253:1532-2392(-)
MTRVELVVLLLLLIWRGSSLITVVVAQPHGLLPVDEKDLLAALVAHELEDVHSLRDPERDEQRAHGAVVRRRTAAALVGRKQQIDRVLELEVDEPVRAEAEDDGERDVDEDVRREHGEIDERAQRLGRGRARAADAERVDVPLAERDEEDRRADADDRQYDAADYGPKPRRGFRVLDYDPHRRGAAEATRVEDVAPAARAVLEFEVRRIQPARVVRLGARDERDLVRVAHHVGRHALCRVGDAARRDVVEREAPHEHVGPGVVGVRRGTRGVAEALVEHGDGVQTR